MKTFTSPLSLTLIATLVAAPALYPSQASSLSSLSSSNASAANSSSSSSTGATAVQSTDTQNYTALTAEQLFELGEKSRTGNGSAKDEKLAAELFTLATDKGSIPALRALGIYYATTSNVKEYLAKTIAAYRAAAEKCDAVAQYKLGICYEQGIGVAKSLPKAKRLYERSANKDYSPAVCKLFDVEQNPEEPVQCTTDSKSAMTAQSETTQSSAATNLASPSPLESNYLGLRYCSEGDHKKAVEYFQLAANNKQPDALYNLACCYEFGNGIAKDIKRASELYQLAADQNLPIAQCAIGRLLIQEGQPINKAKGFELLQQLAAKQNFARAQYLLHQFYCSASLAPRRNYLKALNYLFQAADNNELTSLTIACSILRKGIMVKKDEKKAAEYFEKIKKIVGSEDAARKQLATCTRYKVFIQIQPTTPIDFANEICSICNGINPPFEKGDWIIVTPCLHAFCVDCYNTWWDTKHTLNGDTTCPNCRGNIPTDSCFFGIVL